MFKPHKGSFKAWLFTIGLNITRNEMSKKIDAFKGLDYDVIGDKGAMIKIDVTAKA